MPTFLAMSPHVFAALLLMLTALLALSSWLRRARALAKRQDRQLDLLSEFAHALAASNQSVADISDLLLTYSRRCVSVPEMTLELVYPKQDRVELVAMRDSGQQQSYHPPRPSPAFNWMASQRQPFFSSNLAPSQRPAEIRGAYADPGSLMIVPLIAGANLIGILTAHSPLANAFEKDQVKTLLALVNQSVATTIQAMRQQSREHHLAQLSSICRITERLGSTVDCEELSRRAVQIIEAELGYEDVGLYLMEALSAPLHHCAGTGAAPEGTQGDGRGALAAWAAESARPILVDDLSQDRRCHALGIENCAGSELAIPLKVNEQVVGVLDLYSPQTAAFSREDLLLLEQLAPHVAAALENARLNTSREQEAWASTALLQVADAVSNLGQLQEILDTAARITPILTGIDRCSILLWRREAALFSFAAGHTENSTQPILMEAQSVPSGQIPVLDELHSTTEPVLIAGAPFANLMSGTVAEDEDYHPLILLPLRAQAELYGAILLAGGELHGQLSEHKKVMLAGIADQIATAVANARLHEAQQEEAWVSTALLQIAQALAGSRELGENLNVVVRVTTLLLGVDSCLVLAWPEGAPVLRPLAAHGLSKEANQRLAAMAIPLGAHTRIERVILTSDQPSQQDEHSAEMLASNLLGTLELQSVLVEPSISGSRTWGVLCVGYSGRPYHLNERHLRMIEGIAHQVAVAIENTHLQAASLDQERLAEELRIARRIQTSFLPDSCPSLPGWDICADWHSARSVSGDFYDFITLDGDHLGLVVADVSDKGVPAALFMSICKTLMRVSASEIRRPAKALKRVNSLMLAQTHSDMFVTVFYGILNWRTGHLVYANAGHNPPLLFRHRSGSAARVIEEPPSAASAHTLPASTPSEAAIISLKAKGMVLGVMERLVLEEQETDVFPGDTLILYTDGVTEPINENGEEFGEEGLIRVVAAHRGESSQSLLEGMYAAVTRFVGEQPQFDDYTLIAIQRRLGRTGET